ncbi:MAG: ribosome rescue protein RqcH [Candidatus Bathyarchaeia archaeon]
MLKREFTSFDLVVVVHELKNSILGSRVGNVYQLNPKTLLFKLHRPEKPVFWLVLEAGRRLHLTSYALEKPLRPPAFCMALRKHLRGGWLVDVEQYRFERVAVFYFKTMAGGLRLVLELFGDGNFVLVDEGWRILQALVYKRMRDRNIIRGETFVFAPSSGRNPLEVGGEEFAVGLRAFGDVEVVRAIVRLLSIGGLYAEEVLLRAGVDKAKLCSSLSSAEVNAIFGCLQDLLSAVSCGRFEPSIVLDADGGFVDVVPFRLRRYGEFQHRPYGSFNEALDEFYLRFSIVEEASADLEVEALRREADRLRRVLKGQEEALAKAESEVEANRRIGDAIYAHVGELQMLLDRFLVGGESGVGWSRIVSGVLAEKEAGLRPSVFFEAFDPKGFFVHVCVDGLRFGLDLHCSLFENAGRFYERSKRARQKLEGTRAALEETRRGLMEVEAKIGEAEALGRVKPVEALEALAKRRIKRKEWFEKFRWFLSSEGFLVVAGKDAVSNEVLVKKYTEPHDIVFHADVVGAPFVVVKTGGKRPSEQTLREAAEFAAALSRGWREGFASVDVYWVMPDQLSKAGPSGEYVPHGAFAISGKRNWLRGIPLRLAIGFSAKEDGGIEFLGGPVDAVRARAKAYAVIVPGDQSGREFFRLVLRVLAEGAPKELREKLLGASIEEIRNFIPYGRGRILEV